MPTTPQTLPTVKVFDYLTDPTTGQPVPLGTPVTITWRILQGSVTSPVVQAIPKSQTIYTDANGFWTITVVPTDRLSPANSTYHVSDGYNTYDINPTNAGYPGGDGWQALNIKVAPAPLILNQAGQTVTGTITVIGDLIASRLIAGSLPGGWAGVTGDILANRGGVSPGTGAIFFGSNIAGGHNLYYDGTKFNLTDPLAITGTLTAVSATGMQVNAAGDISGRSFTASAIGPYTAKALAGTVDAALGVFDLGGMVYNTKSQNNATPILQDGSNDAPRINSVITALPAAGGTVFQPSGTSTISARIGDFAKTNYRLLGAGRDSTTIKLANATNLNMFEYQAGGNSLVTLAEMTWDGNKANQTTGGNGVAFAVMSKSVARDLRIINAWARGLYLYNCTDMLVQNVEVENNGKTATADGTQSAIGVWSQRTRIIGNRSDASNDHGIHMSNGPSDMTVIVGNTIHNPNGIGIAGGNPPPTNTTRLAVVANAIDGSVIGHGIDLGGAQDTTVVANVLNSNYGGLTSDTGARQQWIGNVIRSSFGTTAASGIGLYISSSFGGATGYLDNNLFIVAANQFHLGQNWTLAIDSVRGEAVVIGNIGKNNGRTGGNGAILVTGSANPTGNVLVIGNKVYDDANVKLNNYGLQIDASAYHVFAIHNDFRGNKTAPILDNGVATYTHGNLGYNPRGALVSPAPAATGVILYNPFNCDCMVYINGNGAAMTAVAIGGIAAPVNAAHVAVATGGTLATATYWYRVSALNPQGGTLASAETSIAVTGPTGAVLVRWTAVRGATGYNVYGRTTGAELLMVSNVQATTWLDDGSITPSGALPGGDTTGNTNLTGWVAAPANDSVIGLYLPWGNGIKITYTTFVTANWQWFGI